MEKRTFLDMRDIIKASEQHQFTVVSLRIMWNLFAAAQLFPLVEPTSWLTVELKAYDFNSLPFGDHNAAPFVFRVVKYRRTVGQRVVSCINRLNVLSEVLSIKVQRAEFSCLVVWHLLCPSWNEAPSLWNWQRRKTDLSLNARSARVDLYHCLDNELAFMTTTHHWYPFPGRNIVTRLKETFVSPFLWGVEIAFL